MERKRAKSSADSDPDDGPTSPSASRTHLEATFSSASSASARPGFSDHPARLKKRARRSTGEVHAASDSEEQDASQSAGGDEEQPPRSPLQDVTAIALGDEDPEDNDIEICSAFAYSAARPPAANVAWTSLCGRPTPLPPQDMPPSLATTQRWKLSAQQRHVDAFQFHSRDALDRQALPQVDSDSWDPFDHFMRLDSFDDTGGLVWLQASLIDDCAEDGREVHASNFLDSAGRSSGTQRYFDTNEEHQWYEANRRSEYYFRESHIGIGPHQHPLLNQDSDTDVRLHRFDERSSLPRGLVGNGFDLASQPDWFQYDIPWEQTTLSTRCDPQLLADAACHNLLHPKQEAKLLEGPKELHAVLLFRPPDDDEDEDEPYLGASCDSHLSQIHWGPSGKSIVDIPIPPNHTGSHAAAAINEGTGYCWLGHPGGRIELFDPSGYSSEVMAARKSRHSSFSARGIVPDFRTVLPSSETRSCVNNLMAVGPTEVVAVFSGGVILLLRATSSRTAEIVREFSGFLNPQAMYTRACHHAESRLIAVSAWDQKVGIWHLDEQYPLNSPWHRQRRGREILDLRSQPSTKAPADTSKSEGPSLDPLATRSMSDAKLQTAAQQRFGELLWTHACGFSFTPTSWVSDRDGQWEFTRDFYGDINEGGPRPKVISSGLLPSIVCGVSSPHRPMLLYFEPPKRPAVEIGESEEDMAESEEGVVDGEEGIVERDEDYW